MKHSTRNRYHDTEILLLQALGHFHSEDKASAQHLIDQAITIHLDQGIRRPFAEIAKLAPELFSLASNLPLSLQSVLQKLKGNSTATDPFKKPVVVLGNDLTLREIEIVRMTAEGLRNKEIAEMLNVSTVTVKSHLTKIFRKLYVSNRTALVKKAREMEMLN